MEMMTFEDFKRLKESVDEAAKDDTPYMGIINDEIHVNGNPNKTEVRPHNYRLKFAFPKTSEWSETIKQDRTFEISGETDNYFVAYKEYKNVWVSSRRMGDCIEAFAKVLSFMRTVDDKGNVESLNEEQMLSVLTYMNNEVEDAAYEAVAKIIGIPMEVIDFATIDSVIYNVIKIVRDTPDIINSIDLFFALPQGSI